MLTDSTGSTIIRTCLTGAVVAVPEASRVARTLQLFCRRHTCTLFTDSTSSTLVWTRLAGAVVAEPEASGVACACQLF